MRPFIISEIEKRKQEQEDQKRPALRIPVGPPPGWQPPSSGITPEQPRKPDRGVCIINNGDEDDDDDRKQPGSRVHVVTNGYTFG